MNRILCIILLVFAGLTSSFGQTDSSLEASMQDFKVGDTVLIRKEMTNYLTGEKPSKWVYYVKHTIQKVGSSRFPNGILIRGIVSWVAPENLVLVGVVDHRDLSEEARVQQQEQFQQLNEEINKLSDSEKAALSRYASVTKTEVITQEDVKPVSRPKPTLEPEPESEPESEPEPVVEPTPEPEPVVKSEPVFNTDSLSEEVVPANNPWTSDILIKTNVLYDIATVANLGIEIGFKGKYSFDLPFMYTPYTTHDKYRVRTFTAQPEFRYWFDRLNYKHFIGVHGIVSLFNVSAGESLRYQTMRDDNGNYHPLLGVGLSYGYAWFLDKKEHWCMEFTVGVGYAYIQYDKFYNVENGKCFDNGVFHYGGLTKLGLNIAYRFDTTKQPKNK